MFYRELITGMRVLNHHHGFYKSLWQPHQETQSLLVTMMLFFPPIITTNKLTKQHEHCRLLFCDKQSKQFSFANIQDQKRPIVSTQTFFSQLTLQVSRRLSKQA